MNINAFLESLLNSKGRFRTLKGVSAVIDGDGLPVISINGECAEFEIMTDDKHCFLRCFLQQNTARNERMREISDYTQRIYSPYIAPQIWLEDEMLVFDTLGNAHWMDVMLQEKPAGERLERLFSTSAPLVEALGQLSEWLATNDFSHGSITARNIFVEPNGTPVLVDYTHASRQRSDSDQQQINSLLWQVEADLSPASEPLAKYFTIGTMNDGVMCVFDGQQWIYIDKDDRQVVPGSFLEAGDFAENRAVVRIAEGYGLIDIDGRWIVKPELDDLEWDCNNNVAIATLDGVSWLVGRGGERICNADYEQIMSCSDGLLAVRSNGRYGFLRRDGSVAIEPKFDDASSFCDGMARVRIGTEQFVIDIDGAIIQKINALTL